MYQKDLAAITVDHLRTHIKGYLEAVNQAYDRRSTLVTPQAIETASMAGGAMAVTLDKLPAYGVDCIGKVVAPNSENLYTFQYDGHIAGTIVASSRDEADDLVKRHSRAVETFVREHMYIHDTDANVSQYFSLLDFAFVSGNFSGALLERSDDDKEIWLAGFIINVFWVTSEDGPRQH